MSESTCINVADKEVKSGIKSCFRAAVKCLNYHYHISYLEVCKINNVYPSGLLLNKKPFISFVSDQIVAHWEDTINSTQSQLLETLLYGIFEKLIEFEEVFWSELSTLMKETDLEIMEKWFVKLYVYIEKEERKIIKRKKKKLRKLLSNELLKSALTRLDEHKLFFEFKKDLLNFGCNNFDDFENLVNLLLVSGTEHNNLQTSNDDNDLFQPEKTILPDFDN